MLKEYLINLLSRKFLFCMFVSSVASILVYYGLIPPEVYKDLVMFVAGVYLTSNVATRYVKSMDSSQADEESETVDVLKLMKPIGQSNRLKSEGAE